MYHPSPSTWTYNYVGSIRCEKDDACIIIIRYFSRRGEEKLKKKIMKERFGFAFLNAMDQVCN